MNLEMNAVKKDSYYDNGKIKSSSNIVEIFSAMVKGKELSKFGATADKGVKYIKELASKADMGDFGAAAELNTIRRFTIEPLLIEELKLLDFFGKTNIIGFDESIEREVYTHEGEKSRVQAAGGDVVFPFISQQRYPVSSVTVSGGYAVDYRRIQNGDMTKENEGMEQVRRDIRNKSYKYVIETAYNAIKNASGVTYFAEEAGITKTTLDDILTKVRRFGKPSIFGDYAVVSQIDDFVPYDNGTLVAISDEAMEEIRRESYIRMYKGSPVMEIPNMYDTSTKGSDGNFSTILPQNRLFIVPVGVVSPIETWIRGGLTSLTGNDITTGKTLARFDLEIAADVAKGQENRIGVISDTNLE